MATTYQTLNADQLKTAVAGVPHLQEVKWNQNPTKVTNWYNQYLTGGGQDVLGGASTSATQSTPMIPGTNYPQFSYQPYSFDPNSVLPQIQQQAQSIYQPQIQALQSLQGVQKGVAETAKVQNESDFQKQLQQEVESINQRGAFFSGGAATYQTGLQEQHQRDVSTAALQAQAADFQNIAQQAGLSADQAKYVQDQLYSTQGSAYQRYQDAYQNAFQNYQFQTNTAEQARQFNQNLAFDTLKYWQDLGLKKSDAKAAAKQYTDTVKQQGITNSLDQAKLAQQIANDNGMLAVAQQNANTNATNATSGGAFKNF